MTDTFTIKLGQRGALVIPKALRESYNLRPGDCFTILDLDGVFVLSPRRSEVGAIAERLRQTLTEKGETLESMLETLREERERHR
jgi:AbrB family looped-hinge helix DNA binding protein